MNTVQRSKPTVTNNKKPVMIPDETGLWVHLSDHYKTVEKLQARIKELEAELKCV